MHSDFFCFLFIFLPFNLFICRYCLNFVLANNNKFNLQTNQKQNNYGKNRNIGRDNASPFSTGK